MIAASVLESPYFVPSLLGAVLLLQLVLMKKVSALAGKVARLARQAEPDQEARDGDRLAGIKESSSEQRQLFDVFLEEDPARRELPKKEQFAAFRRWRDEKGLNWKKSGDSA